MSHDFKRFDLKLLTSKTNVLIIGGHHSGKTSLVKHILHYFSNDNGLIFDGTGDYAAEFKNVHFNFNTDVLKGLMQQQFIMFKNRNTVKMKSAYTVFDSVFEPDWQLDNHCNKLFRLNMHLNIRTVVTALSPLGIRPNLSTNTDFLFLTRDAIVDHREACLELSGVSPSILDALATLLKRRFGFAVIKLSGELCDVSYYRI